MVTEQYKDAIYFSSLCTVAYPSNNQVHSEIEYKT